MNPLNAFSLFVALSLIFSLPSTAAVVNESFPTVEEGKDISMYDVWLGTANESSPLYWGNYCYFFTADWFFFVQKGGVHNHAYRYVMFNQTPYITRIANALFDEVESRLQVYPNQTYVSFSNGSTVVLENRMCPSCNCRMHAAEFSPYSRAIYWFCDEERLIFGEILE
jgi:hypothetical protein